MLFEDISGQRLSTNVPCFYVSQASSVLVDQKPLLHCGHDLLLDLLPDDLLLDLFPDDLLLDLFPDDLLLDLLPNDLLLDLFPDDLLLDQLSDYL